MTEIEAREVPIEEGVEGEEGEYSSFHVVDDLINHGINGSDISKLKAGGYFTIGALQMATRKALISLKGLSEAKVDKILEAGTKIQAFGFSTGTQILEKRKDVIHISTGSTELDKLLGGGVESKSITEAFGEFRTGKTQICHTLAVTAQLPSSMNGGNGKCIFIDTEGTFRPQRIMQIAERFGIDPMAALDNILVARAFTHEQQFSILPMVVAKMSEEPFALLIMDSITSLFRVDFSGRGELSERQQKLGQLLSQLSKIADEFNVSVFITNQVQSDPSGGAMFVSDPKKPIGGHIMAHASTTRLSLRKGRGETRICKIYDSPCLPESEAVYEIGPGGIADAKE